jgi:hypothetical protein
MLSQKSTKSKSLLKSVVRQNKKYLNKAKEAASSRPTVKTIDILRLINGVNKLSDKSKKLDQLLQNAQNADTDT